MEGLGVIRRAKALTTAQEWSHYLARLAALDDGDDLETCTGSLPVQHPLLEQLQVFAFHELEAPAEVGLDPAVDVLQTLRKTTALLVDALIDGKHVVAFEPFDDHEEHYDLPLDGGLFCLDAARANMRTRISAEER
jgi:hypothetical protein